MLRSITRQRLLVVQPAVGHGDQRAPRAVGDLLRAGAAKRKIVRRQRRRGRRSSATAISTVFSSCRTLPGHE